MNELASQIAPRSRDDMDFIIDLLAHRIGVFVLRLLSGGQFKGERGFAWGGQWWLAVQFYWRRSWRFSRG
ncbi:hypothetical protein [Pseudomonas sp. CP4]|uniref:hypothetical protein n=1 Tax=Pseudomonas sp. CP4 TaxID=3388844 RepID=UPI0039EFFD80